MSTTRQVTQQQQWAEQDHLMQEYEDIEDACNKARRRADFKTVRQMEAAMKMLEKRIWPWMSKEEEDHESR